MNNLKNGHDTIEQYLLNQLSEQERNEFEIQMLDDTALLKEVQLREALINGLRASSDQGQTSKAKERANGNNIVRLNFEQWIRQPMSIAASLLIAVGALSLVQSELSTSSTSVSGLSAFGPSITLETRRGDDNRISASGEAPILLRIDVGPSSNEIFKVDLADDDNASTVLSKPNMRSDSEGWLHVSVNQNLTGNFTIQVTGDNRDLTFPIRFE